MNKRPSLILPRAPRIHDVLAERDIESEIAHLSPVRADECARGSLVSLGMVDNNPAGSYVHLPARYSSIMSELAAGDRIQEFG